MRSQIIFERYGRAALGRKFPYLHAHLKNAPGVEPDLMQLCRSYGAAIALRDEMKKHEDNDPAALKAVEGKCEELEAEVTWSIELSLH